MIKILQRYIAKTIITSIALTALIILGILFLMLMLGELKNIGEGDYSLVQAMIFVLLRLPNEIYQFSPILILLGTIVGLSLLSSHRELAVMRASGFSVKEIIYSVLGAALLLILFISILGEVFAPHLSFKAEMHKENLRNLGQSVVTASGVWFHVDNNFVHVEHIVGRELLEGVTRYQFDDKHRLQVAYFAKKLIFQHGQWLMEEVVKTNFYPERVQSKAYPQANWELKFNPNLLNVGVVDPNEMTLPRLAKFSRYLEQNRLQATQYRYEFWQRIFQPFASLIMIFLAIPFVLGTLSVTTLGWRVMIGIMFGFAFFISKAFLGQLSIVLQLPPIIAAFLPLLAFAILGAYLSKSLIRR